MNVFHVFFESIDFHFQYLFKTNPIWNEPNLPLVLYISNVISKMKTKLTFKVLFNFQPFNYPSCKQEYIMSGRYICMYIYISNIITLRYFQNENKKIIISISFSFSNI